MQIGHFTFNEATRIFETTWQYHLGIIDNFNGTVTKFGDNNRMKLSVIIGKDTLEMELEKMEIENFNKTY